MDVNYLLAREQLSLINAANSSSAEARYVHRGLARGYAAMLVERGFPHHSGSPLAENDA